MSAEGNGSTRTELAASVEDRKVLVTGAAGFVGSHLCERLLTSGNRVWGLDNFDGSYEPSRKRHNIGRALEHCAMHLVEGDVRDQILLEGLMKDVAFDAVVHLAANTDAAASTENPVGVFDVNVIGTLKVLEGLRRHGIPALLFGSSASVYSEDGSAPAAEDARADRPSSPMAASKRAGEMLCYTYHHLFDLSVHCLRLFNVYGPRQRPATSVRRSTPAHNGTSPAEGAGKKPEKRDWVYIDDVVDGLMLSLHRATGRADSNAEYQVINLGSGAAVRPGEMVCTLEEAPNVPNEMATLSALETDISGRAASMDHAEKLLDYRPRTTLKQGLLQLASWMDGDQPTEDPSSQLPSENARSSRKP